MNSATQEIMALDRRVAEFAAVMATLKVTDGDGRELGVEAAMAEMLARLTELRGEGRSLYILGNGGSAAIAGHAVTDFVNVGGLKAMTLHDPSLMTCMANDYGYENAYARILSVMAGKTDVLVAISSSGRSPNIGNAVSAFRKIGGTAVTLSGFGGDNPLRGRGDYNIWLDSRDYGFVEIGHQFILHNLADRLRVGTS